MKKDKQIVEEEKELTDDQQLLLNAVTKRINEKDEEHIKKLESIVAGLDAKLQTVVEVAEVQKKHHSFADMQDENKIEDELGEEVDDEEDE